MLDSGWLTTGAKSKAFEAEFAAFVGARHAVALNSATAALHLALEALGVGPGDEVIVPTWTFAASAEVVFYLGAKPVLIDVDRATLNLTADGVLAAITPRTKAVIPVHFAGRPVAIEELVAALRRSGSPSSRTRRTRSRVGSDPVAGWRGRSAGSACTPSTRPRPSRPARAGCSSRMTRRIADRARLMSLHGIGRDAWKRYARADRGTTRSRMRVTSTT